MSNQLKVLKPSTPTFVSSTVAEPASSDPSSAWSVSNAYASGDTVYVAGTEHRIYECTAAHQGTTTSSSTVTMTIASPCVVTWTSHGKANNTAIVFSTTGALPTGLTVGTTYYVSGATANTFNLASVIGGVAINTTGTQTPTHTARTTSTAPIDRLTGTDPLWLDLGPTNRHAMFDAVVSTGTELTTSGGSPVLEAVVSPGICNGVAVLDVTGVDTVKCEMFNGATLVYTETKGVDNTYISNWYEYFFEPYDVYTDLTFGPLPPYPSATVKLTFTPTAVGVTVHCGAALYGNVVELGRIESSASAGITDYSRKETDEFGITTLVERGFSKHTNYQLLVENAQMRRVFSTLAALRATPAVWIASDDYNYTPFNTFGYPKDWGMNVQYAGYASVSLEIEGLL